MSDERIAQACYEKAMALHGIMMDKGKRWRDQTPDVQHIWLTIAKLAIALAAQRGD